MPPAARPARVAGTSETAMLKRLFKASAIALLLFGCERQQDRAYRSAVMPVLGQAAGLKQALETYVSQEKRDAEQDDRVEQVIKRYIDAVNALPQPTEKKLRYLEIRLAVLGDAAHDEQVTHLFVRLLSVPGDEAHSQQRLAWADAESVGVAQYRDDLALVAGAERVALGTSLVHDRLLAEALTGSPYYLGPSVGQLDSTIRAKEGVARKDLQSLR
jgi:hypothetical protein